MTKQEYMANLQEKLERFRILNQNAKKGEDSGGLQAAFRRGGE